MWSELDAIQHITVDPNQESLVITTLRKQLYYVKLFGQHMLQVHYCFTVILVLKMLKSFV